MDSVSHLQPGVSRDVRLPATIFAYVRQYSGPHQLGLAALSTLVFLLSTAPLELQRRIVNDAIHDGATGMVIALAAGYIAVALAEGGIKYLMNIYRAWVSESAVRHLRRTIAALPATGAGSTAAAAEGIELSMVLSEVEPLGGFIGICTSEPILQGGILLSVFGYMLYLQPVIALVSLVMFSPQLVFVPILQGAINRRVRTRIGVMRDVGGALIERNHGGQEAAMGPDDRIERIFTLNMGIYRLKFGMNFLMNLMHHASVGCVLAIGGWYAATGHIEVGTVVAFISGLSKVNDPWGDIVNWFREMTVSMVKYRLLAEAVTFLNTDAGSADDDRRDRRAR